MKTLYSMLIALVFALSSCALQSQKIVDEVNQSFTGVEKLDVKGTFCKVEVISHQHDHVDFKGELKAVGKSEKYKIVYQKKGSTLKVRIETPRMNTRMLGGSLIFNVPKNTNLDIDNSSGSVLVSGVNSDEFLVEASSGSLEIENIKANAKIATSSGRIRLNNLEGNLNMESSSGSQKIENIDGNVQAEASSGRVLMENINGNVTVKTSSGSIQLDNISGAITAKASSGRINGNQVLLKGNSYFKTSSGGIKVDLKNQIDEINFALSASSGSIRVGDSKYDDHYESTGGNINVKATSNSGSQRFF